MNNGVMKFQAPFEKIKELDCVKEVKLYKSIILQAIIDASNNSSNITAVKLENNAKEWLFNDSQWLLDVCNKANLEVSFVRRIAQRIINFNKK
ncbi:MAG: hypothetical protein H6909_01995 [Rickettsiaceae bacterium]|nr:hypothetical protein [Rickettsiaceae bacterium]